MAASDSDDFMDLGEWVDGDNTIPPFEPMPQEKPSNKAYGLYDGRGTTQVTQCDIPKLAVKVELKGIGVFFLNTLKGHSLYTRMDRVVWNWHVSDLTIIYGVPAPSYELPPAREGDETIATITVPVMAMAITQNMIANKAPSPRHDERIKSRETVRDWYSDKLYTIETIERIKYPKEKR